MPLMSRPAQAAFGYQTATSVARLGGFLQYHRRVPKCLASHLGTVVIRVSPKARDRTEVLRATAYFNSAFEA